MCHFLEIVQYPYNAAFRYQNLWRTPLCTEQIFHIFKIQCVSLFFTLKVMASSTNFLGSLRTLIYKKIIERLDINLSFKKQNEDHRLDFEVGFCF